MKITVSNAIGLVLVLFCITAFLVVYTINAIFSENESPKIVKIATVSDADVSTLTDTMCVVTEEYY